VNVAAAPATVNRPGLHDGFLRLLLDQHAERVRKINEENNARFNKLNQIQAQMIPKLPKNTSYPKECLHYYENVSPQSTKMECRYCHNEISRPGMQLTVDRAMAHDANIKSREVVAAEALEDKMKEIKEKIRNLSLHMQPAAAEPAQYTPMPAQVIKSVSPAAAVPVPAPSIASVSEAKELVFPKLEKESPASSAHEAANPETDKPEASTPAAVKQEDDFEIFEDAENVSITESDDESEAFLTDEEYDILDASDEESPA